MINVVVTSPSFSSSLTLRNELESYFPIVKYNETGKNLKTESLPDFVGDAKGLILGLEKADTSLFNSCKNLKVISKYGVGLNNIDVDAAKAASVLVVYTPGINRRSVAELTLAFMIGITRNVFNSISSVKAGSWVKNGGFEITGKSIGIVGFGNIGKDLARLLRPFDVNIYANDVDNFIEITEYYTVKKVSLGHLLEVCDVISLHVPHTKDTHHLISGAEFKIMKEGATIINTSRGGIIDELALLEAVSNKGIKAALDVFEVEPQLGTKLVSHPHIFPTPHIGGNSREAILAMGRSAIENLRISFGLEKI